MAKGWFFPLYELRENLFRVLLSILIGLIGAKFFIYLRLPMPWMLGPIFTATLASLLGMRIFVPIWIKSLMIMVIGVLFGTTVSPELIGQLILWIPSMIGVLLYLLIVIPPIVFYLIKVAKYDFVTAYFSASPGGIIPMMVMGGAMGGDERKIFLLQSTRMILTVITIPMAFRLFTEYEPSGMVVTGGSFQNINIINGTLMIAVALFGYAIAKLLKIPAPHLIGPMISISLLSLTGISNLEVSDDLVAIAQLIIGSSIGTLFNDIKVKEASIVLMQGLVIASTMIIIACLSAWIVHILTNQPIKPLILAFAPGGFTEMSIVGFGLGIESAFVFAHQMVRYLFLVSLIPACYQHIRKLIYRD